MNDDPTVGTHAVDAPARSRRSVSILLAALALILILGGGTAAAFTVPLTTVTAQTDLANMLPHSTAFYLSANLNPSGATRDNLNAIGRNFTDQPGWSAVQKLLKAGTTGSTPTGSCYQSTGSRATSYLNDLGSETAIALTTTGGLNFSTAASSNSKANTRALEDSVVVVAPLKVQATLVELLAGLPVKLEKTVQSYHGTDIEEQSIKSCGTITGNGPTSLYAAKIKNFIVVAFAVRPVQRVIDTADGRLPNLGTDATYRTLTAHLPADRIAALYTDGSFLRAAQLTPAQTAAMERPSIAAVTVEPARLRFTSYSLAAPRQGTAKSSLTMPGPVLPASSSSTLAARLPSNTLFLISVRKIRPALEGLRSQLQKAGLLSASTAATINPVLDDLVAGMTGEGDLVGLPSPAGLKIDPNNINVPAAFMWQVKDPAAARTRLADVATRLKLRRNLLPAVAGDGTSVMVARAGGSYGYGVQGNWAVVSTSLQETLRSLASKPASTLADAPAFRSTLIPNMLSGSQWYFNLAGLRAEIEGAMLPSLPASARSQYTTTARLVLAPVHSIGGGSGLSPDGTLAINTTVVGLGPGVTKAK